jgi:polyketide biosynthesis acyl carrier protein
MEGACADEEHAVTREDVLNLVKIKAAEIIANLDPAKIDTSKSFKHYGASSLDLVELVSVLMRELNVRLPRSELKKVGTIDELVTALHVARSQALAN